MKPVELYKKLPKKNCGECRMKTCMPFAISVIRGEADFSECPYLKEQEIETLRSLVAKTDWREELILRLKGEIKTIPFSKIAEGIGAELKGNDLILKCMGRVFTISPDGEISTHGHLTPWIKILLLHYIRTSGSGDLTGKWVSFSELKSGMVKALSFQRECEDPLKDLLETNLQGVEMILKRFGAVEMDDFPAKNAWLLYLLPKAPIIILYWQREDEFEPKVKILFDSTADRFLDVESLVFLVEGLVKNIEANLTAS